MEQQKPKIYMVVGCPGAGKSWVCEQLTDKFTYVHHDGYIYLQKEKGPRAYVDEIIKAAAASTKPLLIEAPFSVSQTKDPLESKGFDVTCVYIIENEDVIPARYRKREGKDIPKGHITRQATYRKRAEETKAFFGGSEEVLNHLKAV